MEGAIRGLNVAALDGEPLRPDLAVIDDAQTRDGAKSPIQTSERESIVTGDVLGLAGPDVNMAAVMLCTVIYPNDLSDRFLSPGSGLGRRHHVRPGAGRVRVLGRPHGRVHPGGPWLGRSLD